MFPLFILIFQKKIHTELKTSSQAETLVNILRRESSESKYLNGMNLHDSLNNN